MIDRLNRIKDRYDEINNLLMDPEVSSNISRLKDLSKEISKNAPNWYGVIIKCTKNQIIKKFFSKFSHFFLSIF